MPALSPPSPSATACPPAALATMSVRWLLLARLTLTQARRLGWLLSIVVPLGYGLLGLWAGKDVEWDFRNYHWYNPYAFLTDRLGFDLAVGHHATFYNPALDIPLYLAANHWPAYLTGFALSACQGLNFPLLFWLAWSSFSLQAASRRLALSAATALAGVLGAGALMEVAAVFHDNITSLGILAALLVIVQRRQALISGPLARAAGWTMLSGLLVGTTAGVKLTNATFALGIGGGLLALPVPLRRRLQTTVCFGLGAGIGLGLGGGFWMYRLWQFSGNPFFPYFNDLFQSTLLASASYRDINFIPEGLSTRLLFPFFFSFDSFRVSEWYFRDVRLLTAFVGLPAAALAARLLRRTQATSAAPWADPAVGRLLTVFAVISYGAWVKMFCIYRYLIPLEMLCPLLYALALAWPPISNRTRTTLLLSILILSQTMVQVSFAQRQPWGKRYLEISPPAIEADAMVLMTGHAPMAYVIPYFPPTVPFLRIDGWLCGPQDSATGLARLMQRRAQGHTGPKYVLFQLNEKGNVPQALAAYGLRADEGTCRPVDATLREPLSLCQVRRQP